MISSTAEPNIVEIFAQSEAFCFRGQFGRRLLRRVYVQLEQHTEHFAKTQGFYFGIRFGYDLKEPGDGRLMNFYIEIQQDEVGRDLYEQLKRALKSFGADVVPDTEKNLSGEKEKGRDIRVETGIGRSGDAGQSP
jgi:hypothetical protein